MPRPWYNHVLLRTALRTIIDAAIDQLVDADKFSVEARVPVELSETKNPEHGEYACNFALVASKKAGLNPRALGEMLQNQLNEKFVGPDELILAVELAGPGFLNFRLNPVRVATFLEKILDLGPAFLNSSTAHPRHLNIEFVSVNPNGPITVGSGRGAAFGDTLARILEKVGDKPKREYYVNDGVNSEQMRLFAESIRHFVLLAANLPTEFPEKGYRGDYVSDVANQAMADLPEWLRIIQSLITTESASSLVVICEKLRAGIPAGASFIAALGDSLADVPVVAFQIRSQELMIKRQADDLASFGVHYDLWFSEQSLHNTGRVKTALGKLQASGNAYWAPKSRVIEEVKEPESDDEASTDSDPTKEALWLASTKFQDDKDRVLIRTDGRPAYIAADVAYMENKLGERAFDKGYLILGPDHHGYIGRMNAVVQALGYDLSRFEIIIYQLVRFLKEGKPAPMRKRDGNIYELRDLIRELGQSAAPDATPEEQLLKGRDLSRWFYLMRSHDTAMDFDIDLATKQSDENPVFYVQYAHARICGVLRKAEVEGVSVPFQLSSELSTLLIHPKEQVLIRKLLDLPNEVRRCAQDFGVHRITTYATELARTYHHFYDQCRVIQPEEVPLTQARLALCQAARMTLASSLELLGISAPEKM